MRIIYIQLHCRLFTLYFVSFLEIGAYPGVKTTILVHDRIHKYCLNISGHVSNCSIPVPKLSPLASQSASF